MLRSSMFILVASLALGLPQTQLPHALSQGPAENDQPNLVPDVDIQASGPVHEAFAQPFDAQPEPGPVVPKQPPPNVPEIPPEERPEGDDVQWIPGYWAWDSEKSDYLWISGTYRKTPQDRQFVPGYWTETTEGWRWVPGYWASASQPEVQYTPQPPASLENGPSVPGPEDSLYIPGYWSYQGSTFAWRPGYWSTGYDGRIWIQPCYRWSPAGYVFVSGYWDYPFANRGLLFAPVCFNRPLWQTAGWGYRPYYTVNSGLFLNCLFYRPTFGFYFGNFFGNNWAGRGYRPWYAHHHSPYANYYRWQNRRDPGWYAGLQGGYVQRANGQLPVPPRTFAQQQRLKDGPHFGQVVTPLNKLQDAQVRLTKQTATQLNLQKANIERGRELARERHHFEAKAGPAPAAGGPTRSFKLPLSGSQPHAPKTANIINQGVDRGGFKDHPIGGNNPARPLAIDRAGPQADGPKGGILKQPDIRPNPLGANPGAGSGQPRIIEGKGPANVENRNILPKNVTPVKPLVDNPGAPRVQVGKDPAPRAIVPPAPAKPQVGNNGNLPRIFEGPGANLKPVPPASQPQGPKVINGGQSPFRSESFSGPPKGKSIQPAPFQGRSIQPAPSAPKFAPSAPQVRPAPPARPAGPRASAPVSRPSIQPSRPTFSVRPSAAPSRPPVARPKGGGNAPRRR